MAHTFAEWLRVFVALRQIGDDSLTQGELAQAIGVTKVTINNWMKGKYVPRDPQQVEKLARKLDITAFEADVLYYTVNPAWVKFDTPVDVLEKYEVNRHREEFMPIKPLVETPPSIGDIEHDWRIAFKDTFENNTNHWGLGWRDDGACRVERSIANGRYCLQLENRFHSIATVGGDSLCFTPPTYYASCDMNCIKRNCPDDGYALIFDEVNDGCHTVFRIRDQSRKLSIYRPEFGGDKCTTYLDATFHAAIRPNQSNKLAILANHDQHWFYINNVLVASATIPRIPYSRLDVGIISDSAAPVICEYRNFIVRIPPHQPYSNGTPFYQ